VEGLQVFERARPRSVNELSTLSTNHGGVVTAASRSVWLTAINNRNRKRSFQHVCARVTSCSSSCSVLLIYRPGSRAADASFFTELSDLLDRLMMLSDPIMIVGDLNVRMDRPDDLHCRRLHELLAKYTLSCRSSSLALDHRGLLDVQQLINMCTKSDDSNFFASQG